MEKLTGRILDFGVEDNGMSGADWLDEGEDVLSDSYRDQHTQYFNVWVEKGKPVPVPDNYYHVVNFKHSWAWNSKESQEYIISELRRVVAPRGMVVIVDTFSLGGGEFLIPEEYSEWLIEQFGEEWQVHVNFELGTKPKAKYGTNDDDSLVDPEGDEWLVFSVVAYKQLY